MFSIDGNQWPYPVDIERAAELKPSEISGLLLDRNYFNDVLGTYMSYTVAVVVPPSSLDTYFPLYEALSDPTDGHTFLLPYNGNSITITGRVDNVSDIYVRRPNGGVYWKGLRFTVIANHPSKHYSLSQVLTRGRTIVPEVAAHSEGDTWIWTDGHWELSVWYRDADTTKY